MEELSYEEQVQRARERIREVSPREAMELREAGSVFIDVREPREWNLFRIPGAVHLPLGEVMSGATGDAARDAPTVVYCARGNRSALAAERLQEMGFTAVVSMSQGITGWMDAGGELDQ